ncbi:MAG: YceH family protein [Calditrichia bacterium]
MDRIFSDIEVRILGCLIEKELTTPEYYPLTVNALTNACNQKSNRNPVVSYDQETVAQSLRRLQGEGLVIIVSGAGHRVRKYEHRFMEKLYVSKKEMVVLCELMLRGPQTIGEIRTRGERLRGPQTIGEIRTRGERRYEFSGLDEVREALEEMMNERERPLVKMLPRQPGQKENRYAHLLSGEPIIPETEATEMQAPEGASYTGGSGEKEQRIAALEGEVRELRREIESLKAEFASFKAQFE